MSIQRPKPDKVPTYCVIIIKHFILAQFKKHLVEFSEHFQPGVLRQVGREWWKTALVLACLQEWYVKFKYVEVQMRFDRYNILGWTSLKTFWINLFIKEKWRSGP